MKKKPHKSIYKRTTWVGECTCGTLVYEVEDGTRFVHGTSREHKPMDCEERRRLRQSTPAPQQEDAHD
jgi:hypothetical protein